MTLVLGLAVVFLAGAVADTSRPRDPAEAARLARRVGLRLDGPTADVVGRSLAVRRRWSGIGTMIGIGLGLVVALLDGSLTDNEAFFVVAGSLLGRAGGSAAIAWRERLRPLDPTAPRVGRAVTPTVADYVAPVERWGAWLGAGAAAGLAVVLATAAATDVFGIASPPPALLVAAVVLPLGVMATFEAFAARVVARGQAACSPIELAWSDVLRATFLREALFAGMFVAFGMSLFLVGAVADRTPGGWPDNPGVGIVNGLFLGVIGLAAVLVLAVLVVRPHRHVVRRLWAEVPA